ncbi:MAG TPA: M20/M25/M40 family metallo-hydrolase [Vicinamibacterales bacterium]|nr:M20/M25/M40 family metallo-hydrolase [Vicinamibacterales bacterium]
MDSLTQIRLTRELIDIDSTTGREAAAGKWIAQLLERLGYHVVCQPVSGDRFNVIATLPASGPASLVFSTHFDCVPPFFPSRVEPAGGLVAGGLQPAGADCLYGRGACDAKGILMAQVAAAERLRAAGESRIGLVFVVGEERGSEGAHAANTLAAGSRFLINGEPTDNRIGAATRGVYRVKLSATGRAAHSSLPELGESAIDKLLDALVALRGVSWPEDARLGKTFYSVGLINGGVAPNVISPAADAELMFRTVTGPEPLRALIERTAGHLVEVEDILVVPPVTLATVPGMDSTVFSFTTDIPFLDRWGAPVLVGPGSVTVAHTADEHCDIAELERAVDVYVEVARKLLSQHA